MKVKIGVHGEWKEELETMKTIRGKGVRPVIYPLTTPLFYACYYKGSDFCGNE